MDSFNIIHNRGEPKETTTLKGRRVERRDALFVPEWGLFVVCAPYDDHFIYENPDRSQGVSCYMCTCGSAAVVINSESGQRMFACLFHATYGSHTTSHVNVKDFPAGENVVVKAGKARWI